MTPEYPKYETNYHGEKYIQIAKNKFKNKKGNFGERLMQKLHAKKIVTYMTGSLDACNSGLDINTNDHAIKNYDTLQSKLSNGSPIPFVLLEHKVALFLINNEEAVHFIFDKHVQMQMGLCYFTIKVVEATKAPLCLSKEGKAMKCAMLPTMSFTSN